MSLSRYPQPQIAPGRRDPPAPARAAEVAVDPLNQQGKHGPLESFRYESLRPTSFGFSTIDGVVGLGLRTSRVESQRMLAVGPEVRPYPVAEGQSPNAMDPWHNVAATSPSPAVSPSSAPKRWDWSPTATRLRLELRSHPTACFKPASPEIGGGGIRTHGDFRLSGFQDRCNKPLYHPS